MGSSSRIVDVIERGANLGFFEIAAQVIPLFLLALAFEMRAFHPRDRDRERGATRDERAERVGWAWLSLFTILVLAAGEVGAFRALRRGTPLDWESRLVRDALLLGGVTIILALVAQPLEVLVRQLRPETGERLLRIASWSASVLIVGGGLYVIIATGWSIIRSF